MRKIYDRQTYDQRYRLRNPNWREQNQRWQKSHPESHLKASKKFRYENLEIYREYSRVRACCKYHALPSPHLRNEVWKDTKVIVARESNGQFISWREVD